MFFRFLRKQVRRAFGSPVRLGRRRPQLELLEDRLVPAVVTWVGGSGDWDTPSHWSTGSLPTPADDVLINTPSVTVTHSQSANDSVRTLTSRALLDFSAGSLSLETTSTLSAGLIFSGGTLTGPGNLTILRKLDWTGGTMSGSGATTLAPGCTVSIDGNSSVAMIERTLTNMSVATWSGSNDLYLQDGAVFKNAAGASFLVKNNHTVFNNGGTSPMFINNGSFIKSSSTGTTTMGVPFTSTSLLDIQSGELLLNGGTNNLGGTVIGNGTLAFGPSSTQVSGVFGVNGTVEIDDSATVSFDSSIHIKNLNLSGGILTGLGTVTINPGGQLNWSGGTMSGIGTTVVSAGAVLNLSGSDSENLSGRTLNNLGRATWSGDNDLSLQDGALLINGPGATFLVTNDRTILNKGGTSPMFSNAGGFVKMASTGTTTLGVPFTNTGSLSILSGRLLLGGAGNKLAGTVSNAGTLDFGSSSTSVVGSFTATGPVNLGSTASVSFDSSAILRILNQSGGTLTGKGTVTISGAGGQLNWTGGTMTGSGKTTTSAGTMLNLNGNSQLALIGRTLTNLGLAIWSGSNDLSLQDGALLLNGLGASFTIKNDRTLFGSGSVSPSILNLGNFLKITGSGLTTLGAPLDNRGTLSVATGTISLTGATNKLGGAVVGAGTLKFSSGITNVIGSFLLTGTVNISDPATVSFDSSASVHILNLSGGILTGRKDLTINGAGGQLNWTGGAMSGAGSTTIAASATLKINGSSSENLDARTLTNLGQAIWSGTNDLSLQNGAILTNGPWAVFTIQNDRTISNKGGVSPAILNSGTLIKSSGTATTSLNVPFNNSGILNVLTGTLSLASGGKSPGISSVTAGAVLNVAGGLNVFGQINGTGAVTFTGGSSTVTGMYQPAGPTTVSSFVSVQFLGAGNSGPITSAGQVTLGPTSIFRVTGNYTLLNSGSTVLDGGRLILNLANSKLDIQIGGALSGLGRIDGAVNNAGTVVVGGQGFTGILVVTGNYTQQITASLNVEIGGNRAGSQFDQLTIGGAASLGGTVNTSFIKGFKPAPGGGSWKILTYTSDVGEFTTENVPGSLAVQYNTGDASILAQ